MTEVKKRNKAIPRTKRKTLKLKDQSKIQFAKPEDVTQIVSFGYKSFAENRLSNLGCSPDFNKVVVYFTLMMAEDVMFVQRNKNNDKLLDGVLAMKIGPVWWSDQPILHSVLFYVDKKARNSRMAISLLKAAKEYAIMNQMPIVFELFAQEDVDRKKKLLRFMGFEEVGTYFVFKGNSG